MNTFFTRLAEANKMAAAAAAAVARKKEEAAEEARKKEEEAAEEAARKKEEAAKEAAGLLQDLVAAFYGGAHRVSFPRTQLISRINAWKTNKIGQNELTTFIINDIKMMVLFYTLYDTSTEYSNLKAHIDQTISGLVVDKVNARLEIIRSKTDSLLGPISKKDSQTMKDAITLLINNFTSLNKQGGATRRQLRWVQREIDN